MVSLEIKNIDEREGNFIFKKIDRSIINALRRILISDVPSYCLDTINLRKNNSYMNDDFLSHRIGLIPFCFLSEKESFRNQEECKCINGCQKCMIKFHLNIKNETDKVCPVYSNDFKQEENPFYTMKPISFPLFPKGIMICKLDVDQSIDLTGTIRKGYGREHAKWSCVSTTSYQEILTIKNQEKDLDETLRKNLIQSCPVNIFSEDNGSLKINNEDRCIECFQCKDHVDISIENSNDSFLFFLESNGTYEVKNLLKKSIQILRKKINFYIDQS